MLERAGLWRAASVLITPHDDDMNAYLTLFVRTVSAPARDGGRLMLY